MPGDVFCETTIITVIADSIVEEKETFSLSLQTSERVIVSNEVATVTIIDGDGKNLRQNTITTPETILSYNCIYLQ